MGAERHGQHSRHMGEAASTSVGARGPGPPAWARSVTLVTPRPLSPALLPRAAPWEGRAAVLYNRPSCEPGDPPRLGLRVPAAWIWGPRNFAAMLGPTVVSPESPPEPLLSWGGHGGRAPMQGRPWMQQGPSQPTCWSRVSGGSFCRFSRWEWNSELCSRRAPSSPSTM